MACVYIGEFTGAQIQYAHKSGDKQAFAVGFAQLVVHFGEHLPQGRPRLGVVFDQSLADDHEQGGRHAFARYVGHHHSQTVVVDHEEIVEVAAHFLCRVHGCR